MANKSTQDYLNLLKHHGGNFKPKEFITRPGVSMTDLDYDFFDELLKFRLWTDISTMITSAYRPGDPRAHGAGLAVDIILFNRWRDTITSPMTQWLLATTWPFYGVGIYFDWVYEDDDGNKHPAVGLHIDRYTKDRPLRWLRITETIDDKPTQLYFYQNTTNGQFFNKQTNQSVELTDVISKFWHT